MKLPRLSVVLRGFVAAVAALGGPVASEVARIVLESIGEPKEGSARVFKGQTFEVRPVNLGALGAGLSQALAGKLAGADVREVVEALMNEAGKRGQAWRD